MPNNIRTVTSTLSFSVSDPSDTNAELKGEVDNRPCGLNKGKTNFKPGDEIGFLVYGSPNIVAIRAIPNEGSCREAGGGFTKHTDELSFENSDTATLSYPTTSFTVTWQSSQGNTVGKITGPGKDGKTVTGGAVGYGEFNVKYQSKYTAFYLKTPSVLPEGMKELKIKVRLEGDYYTDEEAEC